MLKNKMRIIVILLITAVSVAFSIKATLSQSSNQALPPGYIEQGAKITAKKYSFTPNELTFTAEKPITVILTSVDGSHSFHVDELNVKSREAKKGQSIVVEFSADKAGKYEFYCAHGSHKKKGMTGMLEITSVNKP